MSLERFEDMAAWQWPEGIEEEVLEVLSDNQGDDEERIRAARIAGDYTVINDDLAEVLLSIVQDSEESDELRGRSAISFGAALETSDLYGYDDPDDAVISEGVFFKIQETLRRLYQDAAVPKFVRRRVVEASVRAPEEWHQNAIREAYSDDDDEWILTAVFCMRWVAGFDKEILDALETKDGDIRCEAVRAAGQQAVKKAWPYITAILTDETEDKTLLLAAIYAAASIHPKKSGQLLVELGDSSDEEIADAAYDAMEEAELWGGV